MLWVYFRFGTKCMRGYRVPFCPMKPCTSAKSYVHIYVRVCTICTNLMHITFLVLHVYLSIWAKLLGVSLLVKQCLYHLSLPRYKQLNFWWFLIRKRSATYLTRMTLYFEMYLLLWNTPVFCEVEYWMLLYSKYKLNKYENCNQIWVKLYHLWDWH